eukprot:gene13119-13249_t
MGWRLPVAPREPTPQEVGILAGISKNDMDQPPLPWAPYLAPYRSMLEKAQRKSATAAAELGQAVDELTAVEMHGPDDVLVTVHAAGPKAAAAVWRPGDGWVAAAADVGCAGHCQGRNPRSVLLWEAAGGAGQGRSNSQ